MATLMVNMSAQRVYAIGGYCSSGLIVGIGTFSALAATGLIPDAFKQQFAGLLYTVFNRFHNRRG